MQDQSTELVSCAKPDGAVAIEDMDCIGLCYRGVIHFFMGKTHYKWLYNIWLVVWNMTFMTFHILGIMIPTDFHIFQRG